MHNIVLLIPDNKFILCRNVLNSIDTVLELINFDYFDELKSDCIYKDKIWLIKTSYNDLLLVMGEFCQTLYLHIFGINSHLFVIEGYTSHW